MRALPLLVGLMLVGPINGWAQESTDRLPSVIERWLDVQTGVFDLDGYLEIFVEDVEFSDGETGAVVRGKAELAEFVRPFTQLRDTSPTLLGYAVNGDTIFIEGELRATAPDGSPAISRGVGVFHVSGSRISSFAMYMFRQSIGP